MRTLYFCPVSIFFLFSSPNLSGHRLDVYHTLTHDVVFVRIYVECKSEMCCTRLAGNAGPKKSPKIRHLGTIAQLCRAISSQLRHISTIGKKLVKQHCLPRMSSQYGELQPAEICWRVWGIPTNFNGSVTAWHSSSGHQPNFVSLSRGRHLHSAGWPSCWALASVFFVDDDDENESFRWRK